MEASQFSMISKNAELRESIERNSKIPFWKRWCANNFNRKNVVTRVATADVLSLAHNLKIALGTVEAVEAVQGMCDRMTYLYDRTDDELRAIYLKISQEDLNGQDRLWTCVAATDSTAPTYAPWTWWQT